MNTPSNDAIYLSGNFNIWQTNDENVRMNMDEYDIYHVVIDKIPGEIIEFKFTRGNWDTVECDWNGNVTCRPNMPDKQTHRTVSK